MKLVEILAAELEKWPEGAKYYAQDYSGSAYPYARKPALMKKVDRIMWSAEHQLSGGGSVRSETSTDHATAIVTREMWQAERDKIQRAGKGIERKNPKPKPKASADGWVRNRGRTDACPGPAWQSVTVVTRDGHVLDFKRAGNVNWKHRQSTGDVMRWKLHKTADQPARDEHEPITATLESTSGPLEWRDRICELDTQLAEVEALYQRQTQEIAQEREGLVDKLKGEGLALVEKGVQPVEDMSDWRNWKAGDLIQRIDYPCEWATEERIAVGDTRAIIDISHDTERLGVMVNRYWMDGRAFKFVSRPAS